MMRSWIESERRILRGLALTMLAVAAGWGTAQSAFGQTAQPGIGKFIKIRWPTSVELDPNENMFYLHNPDGIRQLYKVPLGKTQQDAVKLTHFRDGIGGYALSHDGRWIAITASEGGSEQADLYLYKVSLDYLDPLFKNPDVVYGSVVWRRDSRAFAYRANDESPSDFHVYFFNLADKSHRKVMAGKGYYYPVDFSSDGNKLVVAKYNSASYSQLFEVDLLTDGVREITPKGEKWSFDPIGYTANERSFLVNTNYRGDLKTVYAIQLESGELVAILPELKGREVDFGRIDRHRTFLAVTVNEDGYSTLHLRRVYDFSPITPPQIDKGVVGNITFCGQYLLYSLNNANTPGVVYKWNVNSAGRPGFPLTTADTQGIDVRRFRLPELVRYPSFDGTRIPAFLYLPPGYKKGQRIPFIAYYHGGPEGQYRPSFGRAFQYFLSRGYGIIAPNVRGSSGYGKAYIEADNYKNRFKSVRDGVWAVKYLIDQGYTEKKKVAAWGGSYGGFMVMATITEAPELYGAACNVVGIVNFQTFLEQTKAYRRHLREAEYGPLTDPAFLRSISPLYKVDKITTPLMLAHGLNDPRVPIGEAMQVAVALKRRGVEVAELYFPDEGHGFAKEENRLLYYEQLAKFFDKHLRGR